MNLLLAMYRRYFLLNFSIVYIRFRKKDSSLSFTSERLLNDSTRFATDFNCEFRRSSFRISSFGSNSHVDCLCFSIFNVSVSLYCFRLFRKVLTFTDSK
jgi:hypothetical protein